METAEKHRFPSRHQGSHASVLVHLLLTAAKTPSFGTSAGGQHARTACVRSRPREWARRAWSVGMWKRKVEEEDGEKVHGEENREGG